MKQQKARKNWPLLLLRAITIPIDKRTDTKIKQRKLGVITLQGQHEKFKYDIRTTFKEKARKTFQTLRTNTDF